MSSLPKAGAIPADAVEAMLMQVPAHADMRIEAVLATDAVTGAAVIMVATVAAVGLVATGDVGIAQAYAVPLHVR